MFLLRVRRPYSRHRINLALRRERDLSGMNFSTLGSRFFKEGSGGFTHHTS